MADVAKQIRDKAKQPKPADSHSCPTCTGPISKEQADAFAKSAGFSNGGMVGESGEPLYAGITHGVQDADDMDYDLNDDFLTFPSDENESHEKAEKTRSRLGRIFSREKK